MELKEKRTLTPKETQQYLGLGATRIYQLCQTKGFPCFRINRKVLIDREELDRWIEERSSQQSKTEVQYEK